MKTDRKRDLCEQTRQIHCHISGEVVYERVLQGPSKYSTESISPSGLEPTFI